MNDIQLYRPGIAFMGLGFALWITGILIPILFPLLVAVGIVFVLFGKILLGVGFLMLVVRFIRDLF